MLSNIMGNQAWALVQAKDIRGLRSAIVKVGRVHAFRPRAGSMWILHEAAVAQCLEKVLQWLLVERDALVLQ